MLINNYIIDSLFIVLDAHAFPVLANNVVLDSLPAITHPPIFPFSPQPGECENDGYQSSSGFKAVNSSKACLERFFSSSWINTWVPQTYRASIWRTWEGLVHGQYPRTSYVHKNHLLTRSGSQSMHVTDRAVYAPGSKDMVVLVGILKCYEEENPNEPDSRIEDLVQALQSDLEITE